MTEERKKWTAVTSWTWVQWRFHTKRHSFNNS